MALGLTIPMRYRSPSSIGFNDLRPSCEIVMPSETTVSDLLRIGRNSNAWSSNESRSDMEKSNIPPAGSRLLHVMLLCFFPLFHCLRYKWVKTLEGLRCEANMHTWMLQRVLGL